MSDICTFFFWNLAGRPLIGELAAAVKEHEVDILILAESSLSSEQILSTIPTLSEPETYSKKILIYTTGDPSRMLPAFDDPGRRLTIRRLTFKSCAEILVAAVHFYDKRNWSDDDQLAEATNLARDIVGIEEKFGHARTLLVGDLNMNPFDKAVVAAAGLHGVMARGIARERTRIVSARKYRFFYNPMWKFLGDRGPSPPGTYYYRQAVQVVYFWNILDQVLVRPDLMEALMDIRIIDNVAGRSLLDAEGRPSASDHLPLLFRLRLA